MLTVKCFIKSMPSTKRTVPGSVNTKSEVSEAVLGQISFRFYFICNRTFSSCVF